VDDQPKGAIKNGRRYQELFMRNYLITRQAFFKLVILKIFTAEPMIPRAIRSFKYQTLNVKMYAKDKPKEMIRLATSHILKKANNLI
jgi:hypothetical protein